MHTLYLSLHDIDKVYIHPQVFYEINFSKNYAKFVAKSLFIQLKFRPVACNFIKKETFVQVFS